MLYNVNISVWYCHLFIRKSNSRKILPLVPTFDNLSFFSLEENILCKGYNPLQLLSKNYYWIFSKKRLGVQQVSNTDDLLFNV